ncbi:AMP-dependent synthetase/ligase [Promicromonospora thailandica]|uniref:Acyl-CoA synthetase n=1 Tax=Promicromonospora thailandica TaxID=765201 RepID=A0A9X2FYM4_9MICO|nr:AMP-dependent synthetase/ligase [Promicromonospora thailandica]MCP2263752.1 long-chain acyl-CoA synthetase [Promicromonospora thailandica]BFF17963.1 AMP-dependent synthetase/ligase [Promicromonospora thailandica]
MTLVSSPALVEVPEGTSINTILADRVARTGDETLIERRDSADGPWIEVSARRFEDEVLAVARGLVARGIEPGDRVAIMSRTRYEWTLLDFSIWAAGAVAVPVYETSSAEQVQWILSDADVRLAVVETAAHAATVQQVRHSLPGLEDVLVLDDGALAALRTAGAGISAGIVGERRTAVRRDDLATVIYTSGSTGRPKGVELTHGNFAHLTMNSAVGIPEVLQAPGARTLLFLPLAHVFARFVEVATVAGNAVLGHAPDIKNLVGDLGSFRPTYLLAVPRVFEKVYNSAEQKASSGLKATIFAWAARTAEAWSRALDTPSGPGVGLKVRHAIADRLVYAKLKATMGGQLRWAVSGGAPLGERLGHFFRGSCVTILEGYGLTESTAPTSVNRPGQIVIGSVGPAFFGTDISIADDGEVLLRGPHIFRGYRNQPELTAEVLVDGWFRTGDLGRLDEHGHLHITGRKKEIIVTAGGKNVAPAVLEDRMRAHPLVSQVVVVGDQRPFIGALVTLDAEMLPGWCAANGLPALSVEEARVHPTVLAELDKAAAVANEAVSKAESIRKITVLDIDFTEANGYLTPSIKVKRAQVLADFADTIDTLYGAAAPAANTLQPR